jgi:hypothetical protein
MTKQRVKIALLRYANWNGKAAAIKLLNRVGGVDRLSRLAPEKFQAVINTVMAERPVTPPSFTKAIELVLEHPKCRDINATRELIVNIVGHELRLDDPKWDTFIAAVTSPKVIVLSGERRRRRSKSTS